MMPDVLRDKIREYQEQLEYNRLKFRHETFSRDGADRLIRHNVDLEAKIKRCKELLNVWALIRA